MQMNDGLLIDENVLMMVEALSKSEQELETNVAAVSICGSKRIFSRKCVTWNLITWFLIQGEWTNATLPPWFTSAARNMHQISFPT